MNLIPLSAGYSFEQNRFIQAGVLKGRPVEHVFAQSIQKLFWRPSWTNALKSLDFEWPPNHPLPLSHTDRTGSVWILPDLATSRRVRPDPTGSPRIWPDPDSGRKPGFSVGNRPFGTSQPVRNSLLGRVQRAQGPGRQACAGRTGKGGLDQI